MDDKTMTSITFFPSNKRELLKVKSETYDNTLNHHMPKDSKNELKEVHNPSLSYILFYVQAIFMFD